MPAPNRAGAERRPRRCIVAIAGGGIIDDKPARALAASLVEMGIETIYLGREGDVERIAAAVVNRGADSVELCLSGYGGVVLIRNLLRELIRLGRRDVSIVIHRVKS